jgi:hypothetical protein
MLRGQRDSSPSRPSSTASSASAAGCPTWKSAKELST